LLATSAFAFLAWMGRSLYHQDQYAASREGGLTDTCLRFPRRARTKSKDREITTSTYVLVFHKVLHSK
jgi:hypothetical protein